MYLYIDLIHFNFHTPIAKQVHFSYPIPKITPNVYIHPFYQNPSVKFTSNFVYSSYMHLMYMFWAICFFFLIIRWTWWEGTMMLVIMWNLACLWLLLWQCCRGVSLNMREWLSVPASLVTRWRRSSGGLTISSKHILNQTCYGQR